jgi:hypothetical protein
MVGEAVRSDEMMVGSFLPYQVRFHRNLAMLGKTNPRTDPLEANILGIENDARHRTHFRMSNKVFLYDVSQPFGKNKTQSSLFLRDLSDFIGLSTPVDIPKTMQAHSPNAGFAIDICDDKFHNLRIELIENGKAAAYWIQTYFMINPDVTVSSPECFQTLLSTWSKDPCKQS